MEKKTARLTVLIDPDKKKSPGRTLSATGRDPLSGDPSVDT